MKIFYYHTLEDGSSSNTLFNDPIIINIQSSVFINKEMSVLYEIIEYNYNHLCSLETIGSERDDSDTNSDNSKGDVDITPAD